MGARMTMEGYDAMIRRLTETEAELRDTLSKEALLEGAKVIQQEIQRTVRVSQEDSDHIRDDIQIGNVTATSTGWQIEVGPGEKTGWRAKYLEFGHAKIGGGSVPAYPFMEPAAKKSKQQFMRTVAGIISRGLS